MKSKQHHELVRIWTAVGGLCEDGPQASVWRDWEELRIFTFGI